MDQQGSAVENALWRALRALEEQSALAQRLAERAAGAAQNAAARGFRAQADEARTHARQIRELLIHGAPAAYGDALPQEVS
jgi:hypothetical protein